MEWYKKQELEVIKNKSNLEKQDYTNKIIRPNSSIKSGGMSNIYNYENFKEKNNSQRYPDLNSSNINNISTLKNSSFIGQEEKKNSTSRPLSIQEKKITENSTSYNNNKNVSNQSKNNSSTQRYYLKDNSISDKSTPQYSTGISSSLGNLKLSNVAGKLPSSSEIMNNRNYQLQFSSQAGQGLGFNNVTSHVHNNSYGNNFVSSTGYGQQSNSFKNNGNIYNPSNAKIASSVDYSIKGGLPSSTGNYFGMMNSSSTTNQAKYGLSGYLGNNNSYKGMSNSISTSISKKK